MLMRFKESPDTPPPGMIPDNWGDKVMHACLKIGDTLVMASDGCSSTEADFKGFSLSLTVANEAEADAHVRRAVRPRPGDDAARQDVLLAAFRHAVDRFGVGWMVIVPAEAARSRRRPATPHSSMSRSPGCAGRAPCDGGASAAVAWELGGISVAARPTIVLTENQRGTALRLLAANARRNMVSMIASDCSI